MSSKIAEILFTNNCKSETDGLNSRISSAYRKQFKGQPLRKQPNLEPESSAIMISKYAENKRGERMPPCLTPAVKVTGSDTALFHLILAVPMQNQCRNMSTIAGFMHF